MTVSEGPRHQVRGTKRRWLRATLISVGGLLVVAIGVAAIYAFGLAQSFDSAERIPDAFPDERDRPRISEEPSGAQNILLLGSDTGAVDGTLANASGRSDTIMVVHIPADRSSIQVMSMMRDFWVDIPGHGEAKINAALQFGSVPLAIQTVENLIDVRVDHVAIVDFEGFKEITDALGGVTVDNPKGFNSSHMRGRYFEQGPIGLDGEEALAFVRERYAFADGDYQRVRNQQQLIKAVLDKTLSAETLTNPVKIGNLIRSFSPFMAVDEGFNAAYAAGLSLELRDVRSEDITFFTMPTLGTDQVNGQSIVRVDFDKLEQLKVHFKEDTLSQYVPEHQTIG